jgi:hypothetical protein
MTEDSRVLVNESEAPLDGEDTSDDEIRITTPFDPSKIRVETKNTQMDALIKRIIRNEIDLAPSFQRLGGIWNDVAQSRLIESMLIKIPLPAFYMDASDDDLWLVVDGLQRLTTIKRFVVEESFSLTGMEFLSDYDGKRFSQLPRGFQRRIEETDIVLYLIQPGTPDNVKFDIFRRINTGGEPLSAQEIRHALNQGKVTEFLKNLADSKEFLEATDNGVSSRRMDDRECVLRFLSFTIFEPEKYESGNFDGFLNQAMAKLNKMGEEELFYYSTIFLSSMTRAEAIFGKNSFRKTYKNQSSRFPINKALFESWSYHLARVDKEHWKILEQRSDTLCEKFISLMNSDKEFEASVSQGTGSVRKVRYRFAKISELISETLR